MAKRLRNANSASMLLSFVPSIPEEMRRDIETRRNLSLQFWRQTTLHLEAERGHERVFMILLDLGADVTIQAKDGGTAPDLARDGKDNSYAFFVDVNCKVNELLEDAMEKL
jgi:hypothetical protein